MNEVFRALSQNPMSIQNYEMTHEQCLYAVSINGNAIKKIPKDLHTNEICLEAVRNEGLSLEYCSKKIINENICAEAVKNNGLAIQYVPMKFVTSKLYSYALDQNGLSLRFIPKNRITLKRALRAVQQNGMAIRYVPNNLLNKEILESAVSENGMSLEHIPSNRKSKKLCVRAIESNSMALEFVPKRFKSDEILESAYESNWESFCYFPVEKYTVAACLDFLNKVKTDIDKSIRINHHILSDTVVQFPVEVNGNLNIIKLERVVGVREFIKKYYDSADKSFYTVEKLHYSGTIEERVFNNFHSFYSYLDGALSEADLINFDFEGVELKNYDIRSWKIRSEVLVNQGLYNNSYYKKHIESKSDYVNLQHSKINEEIKALQNIELPEFQRMESGSRNRRFYYISDVHLDHKLINNFPTHASKLEIELFIENVVHELLSSVIEDTMSSDYLLVAGDVSYDLEISKLFFSKLYEKSDFDEIVVVLGNHELWNFNNAQMSVSEIISYYKKEYGEVGVMLLHNELLLINDSRSKIITDEELFNLNTHEIDKISLRYPNIIFGGIGFSGCNSEYNATNGLYRNVIKTLEEDLCQTQQFSVLYNKLIESIPNSKLIVLSHTPKQNWSELNYNSNWYYVNGHTHANVFTKDHEKSIYSDNQVGYYNENFELKYFEISSTYDIFRNYVDGMYLINRMQYIEFNRGMGIQMDFKRYFNKLHMLKRSGVYCFILELKEKLYLLEGGKIRKLEMQFVEYYYENMVNYSDALKVLTNKYNQTLAQISLKIKQVGGSGNIHGCIVDIDFYNHIYLNPVDGTLLPYYATSMMDKYIYSNVETLLIHHRKDLYDNLHLIESEPKVNEYFISENNVYECNSVLFSDETAMYKPSNLIKSIQYLTNSNIIRIWNEDLIESNFEYHEISD
ncbi:DUF4116 domain-containing protein [Fusibacter sp. JL216-2]|uniref:DUF4116 domain-containing protein n=1 Tax=Fusibacter sp. JL216-2 TaxID=3071453 RepID=UPI003D3251E1